MIKTILLFFFFSGSLLAYDKKFDGNSELLEDQVATYSHVSDFLNKKKPCLLAWDYPIADKAFDLISRNNGYYNKVHCIQDLSFNSGTSRETFGCSYTSYNHTTDRYSTALAFSSKECLKGGLEELSSKKHNCLYDFASNNISECMFSAVSSDKKYVPVLLYSEKLQTTSWYETQLKTQLQKIKEKKEKEQKYINEYLKKMKSKENKESQKEKALEKQQNERQKSKKKQEEGFNKLFE